MRGTEIRKAILTPSYAVSIRTCYLMDEVRNEPR